MAPYSGTKYSYTVGTEEWHKSSVQLQITDQPCGEGGMRVAFHAAEVDTQGHSIPCVVKVFKNMDAKGSKRACFDEAMTQMIADSYAQDFNKCGLKEKVAFLPVNVIHLNKPFKGATYVCLEPLLCEGRFVKHSDNVGGVATSANLPQTFSHFTYQGFGLGNLGSGGLSRWKRTHRCNSLCRTLGLNPIEPPESGRGNHQRHPVAVGGGRQGRERRPESDRQMAERLQAEEYARAGGGGGGGGGRAAAAPPMMMMHGGRGRGGVWDSQRYDDTLANAFRRLGL